MSVATGFVLWVGVFVWEAGYVGFICVFYYV